MVRSPIRRSLKTTIHGRYLLRPPVGEGARPRGLLVGFHGYGESAERHMECLESVPGVESWALCAVQGLHRFYRISTGEVVASWMTKEDRELAIADNLRYVEAVLADARATLAIGKNETPLVFAGFSQGVAMAMRAAALGSESCAGIVALAGETPPDMAEGALGALPPVLLGRGEKDTVYREDRMEDDLRLLLAGGVAVEPCEFPGRHEWNEAFGRAVGAFLARIAPDE